jgi:Lanthionine-containing peptide SapB precursor RamS
MSVLDLQAMTVEVPQDNWHGGGHGGGSDLSVLLCDSLVSVALCL